MAKVLIGLSANKPDANLKMPPMQPGTNVRYDSVSDLVSMYVVYSNAKAYPMYYVKF